MLELIQSVINLVQSAEFYSALIAIGILLKALAEAFEAFGRLREGKDWADNAGGKTLWLFEELGKIANWFAPGNKKEQPGIVIRLLQLFKK